MRWFTLIKSAICWLSPHATACVSHGTADATNYQLFWKWNLSGHEHERLSESANGCFTPLPACVLLLGRNHICWSEWLPWRVSYMWSPLLLFLPVVFFLLFQRKIFESKLCLRDIFFVIFWVIIEDHWAKILRMIIVSFYLWQNAVIVLCITLSVACYSADDLSGASTNT